MNRTILCIRQCLTMQRSESALIKISTVTGIYLPGHDTRTESVNAGTYNNIIKISTEYHHRFFNINIKFIWYVMYYKYSKLCTYT